MALEKNEVERLLLEGKTLQQIADIYGCTREWVRQFKVKNLKHLSRYNSGKSVQVREAQAKKSKEFRSKYGRENWYLDELGRAQSLAFIRKRQNTKYTGWEFTITKDDIEWPSHCPILGIELDWFSDYRQDNSPSFDRIDCTKGYVPGNVIICSWRANRIKNNGSSEEHYKIAKWLESKGL
jgi:hypothetical protein